jgi:hypothetical protein
MKADDVAEEGLGDGLSGVGVGQRDEVAVLAEEVDDGEDDRLALHPGKRFDEIDADVGPHAGGDGQLLEQIGWAHVDQLVLLASGARRHKFLHQTLHVGKMENTPETMQGAVDALVAVIVDRGHDLLEER